MGRFVPATLGRAFAPSEVIPGEVQTLSDELKRLGFPEPGIDHKQWRALARVVQVNPAEMSIQEIYQEAIAWVERIQLAERIRRQITMPCLCRGGEAPRTEDVDSPSIGFEFVGSRQWENWGMGLEADGHWHLFHFQRRSGCWIRHQHVSLRIPSGLPDSLAREFVSGRGTLSETAAHTLWKEHAVGYAMHGRTIDAVKSPLSRLRKHVASAIHAEGHRPRGNPIVWQPKEKAWHARLRFGTAGRGERRGVGFRPVH